MFEYIKEAYGVDPRVGQRIRFYGKREGTITKDCGQYLGVKFDDTPKILSRVHPTDQVEYLD